MSEPDEDLACRFCREEATEENPLFYPCKCTGSIKYIHKSCLDEWLKHGDNKTCGVCMEKYAYKTVYRENMPMYMPLKDTALQMFNIVAPPMQHVARVVFVLMMWLCVLPLTVHWNIKLLKFITSCIFNGASLSPITEGVSSNSGYMPEFIYKIVVVVLRSMVWILGKTVFILLPNRYIETAFNQCLSLTINAITSWILTFICLGAWSLAKSIYRLAIHSHNVEIEETNTVKVVSYDDAVKELMEMGDIIDNDVRRRRNVRETRIQRQMEMGNVIDNDVRRRRNVRETRIQRQMEVDDVIDNTVHRIRNVRAVRMQEHRRRMEEYRRQMEEHRRRMDEMNQALEDIRQRIEQQNENEILNFDWVDNLGVYHIDRDVVKLYQKCLVRVQLMLVALIWVPFFLGLVVGFTQLVAIIGYPYKSYIYIANLATKYGVEYAFNGIQWMLALKVISWFITLSLVSDFVIVLVALPSWIEVCGLSDPLIQGIKTLASVVISENAGKQFSNYLNTMASETVAQPFSSSYQGIVCTGYVAGLAILWPATYYIMKNTSNKDMAKEMWVWKRSGNIFIAGTMGVLLVLINLGVIAYLSLAPALGFSPLESLKDQLNLQLLTSLICYTTCGCVYTSLFSYTTKAWAKNIRPGVMWYHPNVNTYNVGFSNIVRKYTLKKFIPATIKYIAGAMAFSFPFITVPALIVAKVMPSKFIILFGGLNDFNGTPGYILGLLTALVLLRYQSNICGIFNAVFNFVSTNAAQSLRLTQYITGQANILDEGHWSLAQIPWIPIPFTCLTMPNDIVEAAFKQVSETVSDRAKTRVRKNSVPTKKFYARIQRVIDEKLAKSHPSLKFTLQPNNMRVPTVNTLKFVEGRVDVVPVNDFGLPTEWIHDYESADNPKLQRWARVQGRSLPPTAPGADDERSAFKREEHCVMYVPPMREFREDMYMILMMFIMPLFLVAVLGVFQCAGVFALKCTPFTCNNAIALACVGVLVFTAMRSIGGALEKLLAKVCHENNSFAEKVHEIKKAIFDIVKVTWNIGITGFAFMWVIPVLIGMAIELYYNVLYAHYFSVGYLNHAADTSALSIAWGLWKGSILLWIGAVVVLEVADMIVPSIVDNMDHPRRWRVRRIMRRWALPLIAQLGTVCMLPTVLAALSMAQRGTLSAGACWDLLLLKDTVALAPHIRMTLLAIIVVTVGTKAVLLYKACAEIVRNRLYGNELVLENIDGSSSPHFGTPSPATPAAE